MLGHSQGKGSLNRNVMHTVKLNTKFIVKQT